MANAFLLYEWSGPPRPRGQVVSSNFSVLKRTAGKGHEFIAMIRNHRRCSFHSTVNGWSESPAPACDVSAIAQPFAEIWEMGLIFLFFLPIIAGVFDVVGGIMPRVIDNQSLSPLIWKMRVEVPRLVAKAEAGQFVILRVNEQGERIPMSIAGLDKENGFLTVIYQVVGKTSALMTTVPAGDELADCIGPLGIRSHVENWGKTCVVGGGIGIAPVYPIAQAYKAAGNELSTIIGARSRDLLFYEEEHKAVADELHVCTDDGSYGQHGFVSDVLKKLLDDGTKFGMVMAIGPVPMMRVVCNLTKEYDVPTWVSLNPLMVDGTGMCGGCRVNVGGEIKFACVDGPDFDGHKVDFDLLTSRLSAYREQERAAMKRFQDDPNCRLTKAIRDFSYPD